jgi:putative endonuclease
LGLIRRPAALATLTLDRMPYVYILECADGSFYVGSTRDLEYRLAQHQAGIGCKYTSKRRPVKVVFSEEYARIDDAYDREKQLQGWGRAKRQALIEGRFTDLPGLSRSRSAPKAD